MCRLTMTTPSKTGLLVAGLILILSGRVLASTTYEPAFTPTLNITKAPGKITIDGDLEATEWQHAGKEYRFVEVYPGDNTIPEVVTEVMMTYDADKLYVAFVCHDNPNDIRATMCQRDQFGGDDAVSVFIDPYGTAAWAYQLFVNPYGIQRDALWTKTFQMSDPVFNLVWESAARITETGWQAELAVPFSGMRFPNKDVQSWKIDLQRIRPRNSFFQYAWSARDRNEQCFPCQWGTVEGIGDVHPGKGFEIIPEFVSYQDGSLSIDPITDNLGQRTGPDNLNFDNEDIKGSPSLNAKYSLSSDVTMEVALNPDFSQIESDAAQIDVNSTMSLYYPERRPFFQEGSDIFSTLFNALYSRTINDPSFAAKVTGRKEKTRFGYVGAVDENSPYTIPMDDEDEMFNAGKSYINAFRVSQSIGGQSHLGMVLCDRRFEGNGSGTVAAIDGDIRLSQNYRIDGQFVLTHTQEPNNHRYTSYFPGTMAPGWEDSVEYILDNWTFINGKQTAKFDSVHTLKFDGESYYGFGSITRLIRDSRNWNFHIDYNQVNSTYRTQLGYDPYNNYHNLDLRTFYVFYPKSGIFEQIVPFIGCYNRWNFDGVHKIESYFASINTNIKYAQTSLGINTSQSKRIYQGLLYKNLWEVNLDGGCRLTEEVNFNLLAIQRRAIAYSYGVRDNELEVIASMNLKPIDRLTITPSVSYIMGKNFDKINIYDDSTGYLLHIVPTETRIFEQNIFRSRLQLQINKQFSLRLIVQYNEFEYLSDPINELYRTAKRWDIDPLFTYRLSSFSVLYLGSTSDFGYQTYVNSFDPETEAIGTTSEWKLNNRQFFLKLQYMLQM